MNPGRAALVAWAERTIEEGSRSFSFASRLFDRPTRERAWLLYAWCRHCDDVADGQALGFAAGAAGSVDRLRQRTERALDGEKSGEMPFDALAHVAGECTIPRRFIDDHLDGFALDAAEWRPHTEADLIRYCYHVAGAVGCMMAVVMGVPPDDEETLARASELGLAFQLANIARDIADDAAIGRCYLPSEWLDKAGMTPDTVLAPEHRSALTALSARLCALAQTFEASAQIGARKLPLRSRWAVLSAAGIYGEIAREVERRGPAAWDERVVVGKRRKLRHVARAFVQATRG